MIDSGTDEMADDAPMTPKHHDRSDGGRFVSVARNELAVTARAFFAPVVGTVNVVRSLLSETPATPTRDHPKKDAA